MRKWALALGGVVACGSAHEDVASSNATVALLPGPTKPNVGQLDRRRAGDASARAVHHRQAPFLLLHAHK